VSAVGATPLAITDCLNFGNPERPEIMWQFVEAIEGLRMACEDLEVPVVSGNVSLYNETNGVGIYPTPMIGMVGLLDNVEAHATQGFKNDGDVILLLGETLEEIGGSEYLKTVHGKVAGDAPQLNLVLEKAVQKFCRTAIAEGLVRSAHDVSEGGLAVALAECCITGPELRGATVRLEGSLRPDVHLFSESQSRIILSVPAVHARMLVERAGMTGLAISKLGTVGGSRLVIEGMLDVPVTEIQRIWRGSFDHLMETKANA
jgi:phosphoribosylformylglycinamidine synthase